MIYTPVLPARTLERVERYKHAVSRGTATGARFQSELDGSDVASLSTESFLERLANTKPPLIFAESAVVGDGSDWTMEELQILGDLSVAVPVTVFDDGAHHRAVPHKTPFAATLLYTPGALLRSGYDDMPADWADVHPDGEFDQNAYTALYERRLMPVLRWVERAAAGAGRPALVTIPGMGCGQFAGPYAGMLAPRFEAALESLLAAHGASLPSVRAIWFDPYNECRPARRKVTGIEFVTQPLVHGGHPQLSHPSAFGYGGCDLYSFVAWDHVSWPGNDYWGGSRATDDGVKAAATDTMRAMTGVKGLYDATRTAYLPPGGFSDWRDVLRDSGVRLKVADRLFTA